MRFINFNTKIIKTKIIIGLAGEELGEPNKIKISCVIECDQNEIFVDATDHNPTSPVWKHRAHLYFSLLFSHFN